MRLSGQDSCRGTFIQRHSVFVDQVTEERYIPLANLDPVQAMFAVIDSPLSEASVMGFEYGFSQAEPNALVMWEAQFGDFAKGAQVVIDQFISSGEAKWLRMGGLVLLLPMVTRDRAQNIHLLGLSVIYSFVQRIICR